MPVRAHRPRAGAARRHRAGGAGPDRRGLAGRAGRGRDRARRGAQPGAQRDHPPALRGGRAPAAATRCRTGPSGASRSCFKDLGAALAGQPLHMGMRALKEADFRAPVDTYLVAALPRGGPRHHRQDEHARARASCRPPSPTPTARRATPGTPRASHRRLERRLRGRGRRRDRADRPRQRRRRLDPDPGQCLRAGRPEADPRSGSPRGPLVGDSISGLTCELVVSRSRPRHRRAARRGARPGPRRPLRGAAAARPYVEELDARPGAAADRRGDRVRWPSLEVDPDVVGGDARRRDAARVARPRASTDSAPGGFEGMRADRDVHDPLGGAARRRRMRAARRGARPRARPGRRRAADLGARRAGHGGSAPPSTSAPSASTSAMARMVARLVRAAASTCCSRRRIGEPPPPLGTFDDSGHDPLRAMERAKVTGGVHRRLQRHRPAGDLAAASLERRRAARSASSSSPPLGPRGPADPRRRPARAGAALGRAHAPRSFAGIISAMSDTEPMARSAGVITAMVTPFAEDGSVDLEAARGARAPPGRQRLARPGRRRHHRRVADAHATRRSSTLLEAVKDEVGDAATVICGTGTNDTRHSVELPAAAAGRRRRRPRRHARTTTSRTGPGCARTSRPSPRPPARPR